MRSCLYDRVFLVPAAKGFRGWHPGNDNRNDPEQKVRGAKISIAWWLVPCVVVWLASAMVFS